MGDDFPYVPVFRFYLVRQWVHARVSQGCCGMAGFAGYDAPRAVFFDSGWSWICCVPFGRQAQDFCFMVLWS